jgi:prepilin-type N-terminal cleavage/methylation domain-containing protein
MIRLRDDSAFSLLEVLASIAVFSIVAAGLTAATVGSIRANGTSRDASAAAALVQNKIEQLRSLDPAANPLDLRGGFHLDPITPMDYLGQAGTKFRRTWAVTPASPTRGLAEVVVTVSWTAPIARSVSAVTYVCQTSTCS